MDDSAHLAVIRLRIISPSNQAPYTLEELARLGGVSPALVQRYLDEGLLEAIAGNVRTSWFFDDSTLFELRKIQRLRRELGVNIAGVGVIRELQRQIDELKSELDASRQTRSR
ncbi:MAG TPA: chaperone modulator CbpM [Methylomirabilota bacterium]|nr:chaperone modulator CbpM [Methylomirabilota bacterium]